MHNGRNVYPATPAGVAASQFDGARNLFFVAVDQWLLNETIFPQDRTQYIVDTIKALQDKLRLM